jgi:MOSC domain-containing protein YiiM
VLVVARPAVDERTTPARARLTPEGGVEGDRWALRDKLVFDTQVTVMRAGVARAIANGQPIELAGDNLFVDLDLSYTNLPAGTRLRVGTALCEVTPKPHNGCEKFAARFGQDARAITAAEEFRGWRLRGLHVRVVEAGDVGPGDRIHVLQRSTPSPVSENDALARGALLFDSAAFFEAHEVWEQQWRVETDPARRRCLQGLIQVAAAFHKLLVVGSADSASRLLTRAMAKLDACQTCARGPNLGAFREGLRRCAHSIANGGFDRSAIPPAAPLFAATS